MFSATLFDYNGVLVDDEAVHLAAFRDVLAPRGMSIDDAVYWERYLGLDDVGAFSKMLADAGQSVSDALIAELVAEKSPLYLERAARGLALFDGAADAVRSRALHGPVGVVSGALRTEVEVGLGLLGVRALVRFVVSAEDVSHCKPDPEGYQKALAQLPEVNRESVLVIEDSLPGVRAAKAAGLACVAVAHSHPEALLLDAGADVVALRLDQVTEGTLTHLWRRLHAA